MELPLYQVDAFADRVFSGNPAAVCPLDKWLPDETMQAIAAENNLSETAFFVAESGGYHLRWFTPVSEVDLCGHATVATALILWTELGAKESELHFSSQSGKLVVRRDGDRIVLDFPSRMPMPCPIPDALLAGIGMTPVEILASRDYFVVLAAEKEVRKLVPDLAKLSELDRLGTIVTAKGKDCDFVSRFFCPGEGIPEDPVTGSAHCSLIPYWAGKLGKTELFARQVSRRGGELWCRHAGDRVLIGGQAKLYLRGTIMI